MWCVWVEERTRGRLASWPAGVLVVASIEVGTGGEGDDGS